MPAAADKRLQIRLCAVDIFERDAIGNYCLALAELLERSGFGVAVYAEHYADRGARPIRNAERLFSDIESDDILLVNYSIFDPYLPRYLSLPNRKLCIFHNVTPPHFFSGWQEDVHEQCRKAYEQLALLDGFDELVAQSEFSARTLRASLPQPRFITVAPPIFDFQYRRSDTAPTELARLPLTALFVGRVVPHKGIHNLLRLTGELRRLDQRWRLTIAGVSPSGAYRSYLEALARELGLDGQLALTGEISSDDLYRHYRTVSCFVCLSEHEGFCIPVFEAMLFGQPVFALAAGAVPEVLGGAGTLLDNLDLRIAAEMIDTTMKDPVRVSAIVAEQQKRAAEILRLSTGAPLLRVIERMVNRNRSI